MQTIKKYLLYKGLQRPLVFKMFKGRFIFLALGSMGAGIVAGGIVTALISSIGGLVTLAAVSMPLLMLTLRKQKRGLSDKKRDQAIYISKPILIKGSENDRKKKDI